MYNHAFPSRTAERFDGDEDAREMCGIAGIMERGGCIAPSLEAVAWKMIAPLVHRGPDAGGVWTDAEAGVAIGHRRLSIIDLSPAGAQPMVSASGRYVLSYNGEIYNAPELRAELESRGAGFRGHSDTEVLLEGCAAWGVERTAQRLIGMFAFALWDRAERCLYLVRDRMGIKPLYYSATPDHFSFASELTGLRAHPGFDRAIDRDAVEAFLALDYIPAPHSIFRDARKLEPGTILRVSAATPAEVRIAPYWMLAEAAQKGCEDRFPGSFEEATDELERLLSDAVKRRMVSDVPLGAFLSGGIDSSTVVALMQKHSVKPVQTFSIGFEEAAYNEAHHAGAVAQHLGTNHNELYLTPAEIGEYGPAFLGSCDEPFADASLFPTSFLSRLARRQVTVALSGDGGDELFGGYDRHPAAARILGHPAFGYPQAARVLLRWLVPLMPRRMRTTLARLMDRRAPLTPSAIRMLAAAIDNPALIHYRLSHGRVRVLGGKALGPKIAVNLITDCLQKCDFLSAPERQQYIDVAGYLPDDILTKVDRASMAVSLEVRVPILDHRIVEFAFRLPPAMKTDALETKLILKKILGRYAPRSMFDRPKQGFGAPVRSWLRGPLNEWALDSMAGGAILRQELMSPYAVRQTVHRLRSGQLRRGDFQKVALAAWCESHL